MMGRNMYIKHMKDDQEGFHQGCLSGVVHAFDYHQWNYIRKISHRKHKGGRSSDGTGNLHTTLLQNQELEQLFGGSKRTLKSRIKVFSRRRKCKKQDAGFSPGQQLQRTYSLHHLEPSDRRLDEIWKQKKSEIVFLPGTLDSENRSLGSPQINQFQNDADICELIEGEKELFQEIIRNGDDGTKMFLDMHPNFSVKARFIKSGSFPTADISRKMTFTPSKLQNKINESWVSSERGFQSGSNIEKYKKHFRAKSWNFSYDSEEMPINKKNLELFQSLKAESKEEEKNEAIIPPEESQNIINNECQDKDEASTKLSPLTDLDAHPKKRDDEKDSKCCIELDENSDVKRDFIHRKSYSLSDSRDRYSRLAEFTSRSGIELQSSKSLKLRNEYDPPSTRNVSFRRISSIFHLDSYYSIQKDEQGNAQLAILPVETVPENGSFVEGDNNAEEIQNETVERMEDAGCLEGENSINIGDLEESIDNRIMIKIKEENAYSSENTDDFMSVPIHDSNSENFKEKSSEQVCKAYSSMNVKQRVGNDNLLDNKTHHKNFEDENEKDSDLCYVRELLARSSFCKDITNEFWLSAEHLLVNEYIFEEMEADWHQEIENEKEDSTYRHCTYHQILFDVVNEAIVYLHDRTSLCYPKTLSCSFRVHPMPIRRLIDEEIIAITSSLFSRKAKDNQSVDDIVYGDMERDDGWMNLYSESECLGMELEDIISDELLDELLFGELAEFH